MSAKLRIGLIGAGFIGKAHASRYAEERDVEARTVAASRGDRARGLAEIIGAPNWTTSWQEVVADPEVDAVDVCTPNDLHYPVIMSAIEHGKPFLVEKPLARSLEEGRKVVEAQERAGVLGVYGENMRFAPAYLKAKEIIDEDGIGPVIMLRINEIHNGPFHSEWFWDGQRTGGGALIDMGIHGLFVAEWLASDRVEYVSADVGTLKWHERCRHGAEDTAFAILRFGRGALAELVNSWAATTGLDVRVEVYGTEGSIFLDSSREAAGLKVYSEGGYGRRLDAEARERPHVAPTVGWSAPIPDEWHVHGLANEIRHFLACLRGEAEPACTPRDGMRALELVDAIYRAAESHQRTPT
jgi:myo-inositol 2-dehydrogenase/D-chiro-inositol 1-dehydrogenase